MQTELKGMSRKELLALKKRIDVALRRIVEKERKEALVAAEKVVKAHGFTLDEVIQPNTRKRTTAKSRSTSAPAKYANPQDQMQTWTGKGRRPEWFKTAVANGATPESLAIN